MEEPLRFNTNDGSIRVSPNGKEAERLTDQSGTGLVFSVRPVRKHEKVWFRFKNMTGSIRFGFTSRPPHILAASSSESLSGTIYWSARLTRDSISCKSNEIWYYYATSEGDVHLACDGKDQKVFFCKVNFYKAQWPVFWLEVDTALELMDPIQFLIKPPAQETPRQKVIKATSKAESLGFFNLHMDINSRIVQGNRSIKKNELICVSFERIENVHIWNLKSTITFGFTKNGPSGNTNLNIPGYWLETLDTEYFEEGNILHFHVTSSGEIQYGINGRLERLICLDIDTRSPPLYVLIKLSHNCSLKIIDPHTILNIWINEKKECKKKMKKGKIVKKKNLHTIEVPTTSNPPIDSITEKVIDAETESADASSSQNVTSIHKSLSFNPVYEGKLSTTFGGSRTLCCPEMQSNGISFSDRPVRTNEVISFRIVKCDYIMAFGFSRFDPSIHSIPATIAREVCFPPGYWYGFLDPRYAKPGVIWYFYLNSSGEVHIGVNGKDVYVYFAELYLHDNDHWVFMEVFGNTVLEYVDPPAGVVGPPALRTPEELILMPSAAVPCLTFSHVCDFTDDDDRKTIAFGSRAINVYEMIRILIVKTFQTSRSIIFGFTKHDPSKIEMSPNNIHYNEQDASGFWKIILERRFCVNDNILDFHVNAAGDIHYCINGGHVGVRYIGVDVANPLWVVIQLCPDSTVKFVPYRRAIDAEENKVAGEIGKAFLDLNIGQASADDVSKQNQAGSRQKRSDIENPPASAPSAPDQTDLPTSQGGTAPETECIICNDLEANTAFFPCGHLCTCYECAVKTWKSLGNGLCPICRANIQHILRTYK